MRAATVREEMYMKKLILIWVMCLVVVVGLLRGGVAAGQATAAAEEKAVELPIGKENFGDLRIVAYPKDEAKEGLLAIGMYSRTRMPPLPALYEWAVKGTVLRGPVEVIGRLFDTSTPVEIQSFVLKGHEITIGVALSPKASGEAHYLWGELPKDLKAGVYHVLLTAYECEQKDGKWVFAPKTEIRAFYQMESYFFVPQDLEAEKAWQVEDKKVEKAMAALHEKLVFLEKEFPKVKAGDEVSFYPYEGRTAAGDLTMDGWHLQYNWDFGVPRKPPAEGTSGIAVDVSALRHDQGLKLKDYQAVQGAVHWNGKDEVRNYALDGREYGWKFHVFVAGNRVDVVKKVNEVVDEAVNGLVKELGAEGKR
jgi:hypothetical protein